MIKKSQFRMAVLSCVLLTASFSVSAAEESVAVEPAKVVEGAAPAAAVPAEANNKKSYGAKSLNKAAHGLANVTTGWLELPKNIYIMTRETNVLYGVIGGTGMGIFRTIGRTGLGVFDLITAPIPTDPMVNPGYIWEKFGTKTTYGTHFYLEEPVSRTPPQ